MIIQDSREQRGFFSPGEAIIQKLCVGDYTTTDLISKFHIERKSANDLYGSIIQGHNRFRREIMRAKETNIELVIFVECPYHEFVSKQWSERARTLRTPSKTLTKILSTLESKYEIKIEWCLNREDFKERMEELFVQKTKELQSAVGEMRS